jgi:hypothetical protein
MSPVPVSKIETVTGPSRIGKVREPRWIVTAVLTDEPAAQGLAAMLTSGREVEASGTVQVTWRVGGQEYERMPPQVPLLVVGVSATKSGVVIHAAKVGTG